MKKKVETEASHGFSRRNLFRAVLGGTMASAVSSGASGVEAAPPTAEVGDQGMYAVITGSGSAMADPERGNASAAVVVDGTVLQFDFGRKTMDNLMRVGINPINLDYIFFTHLHFDHIATYDYFIISSWIAGRRDPYKVFGPPGTVAMSNGALHHMHEMDVRFVKYIVDTWPNIAEESPVAEPPVEVTDAEPGLVVETDDFTVTSTATPHLSPPNMYSRGYRVDSKYGSVVISGDTAPSENMVGLAKDADILIHECVIPDYGMTTAGKFSRKEFHVKETKNQRTGHTSPTGLGRLAEQAGVKKLVAYHLAPYTSVPAAVEMSEKYTGPNPGPEIWSKYIHAMKNQYSGPVILAEDAMVLKVS